MPPPQRDEQPQLPRYTRAPHSHEENISVCSGNQRGQEQAKQQTQNDIYRISSYSHISKCFT